MDPVTIKPTIRWSKVGSETVILNDRAGTLLRLNDTAGVIWEQLAAGRTNEEIVRNLQATFTVTADVAARDLGDLRQQLVELEIVER